MQNSLPDHIDTIELTTSVVVAYISNNSVPKSDLPGLIEAVHGAFAKLVSGQSVVEAPAEVQAPAVSVRKSLTPDYLICLDDGKKFKSLKRHLKLLGMSPEQYREKWNLPSDYPMVAPNYAAQRSELAKKIGLGQIRAGDAPRKRGRPPKVRT